MVSIIIPAYNVEKYIGDCLQSVTAQSFRDIEIIVVNDGSTDSTRNIIEEIALTDNRLRVINKTNGGLSDARNAGLDVARGEWLVFVDGDDMLASDAVEILLHAAQGTDSEIACGRYTRRLPFPTRNRLPKEIRTTVLTADEAILDILYQKHIEPSAWGKIYRSEIFRNLRFRKGILYEDLDLFDSVFNLARKVALTDAVVSFYRPNPGSILGTFNTRRLDVLDVTRRLEERCRNRSVEFGRAAADRRLSANFNILGLLAANDGDNSHSEAADDCWSVIKRLRRGSLFNPHVRFKNKAGILISLMGRRLLCRVLSRHYSR